MKENIDARRSKRFTYFILLLNALVWSVMLDVAFISISRGELAVLLIGNPLTLLYRAANEGLISALLILAPYFLIVWMASLISYFFLVRIVRLKPSNFLPLPLIVLSFPIVWTTSIYLYGSAKEFAVQKTLKRTGVENVQLDNTYRNNQYGFEFRYPNSWIAGSHDPNVKDPLRLYISDPDYEVEERYFGYDIPAVAIKGGAWLGVTVEKNPVGYSDDIVVEFNQRYPNYQDHYLDKEISVSGQKAIVRINNTSRNTNVQLYVKLPYDIDDQSYRLHLSVSAPLKEKQQYLTLFDQIISSLSFFTTTPSETSNWQVYSSDQLGFAIQYPPYMNVKESTGEVKIFGRSGICPVFNDLNNFPVDELRFIFQRHTGKSFSEMWERVYGFPFGEKAYDGTTLIGGNNAYYFYQGAEMPEGRTAYLVYLGQYEAMQIDAYTLAIDSSNCTPSGLISSDQKTEDQMLSTIKFMDRDKEGTMDLEQYVNSQYGYRVKYPSYLTPNEIDDDLTLSFMSFKSPTENDEGNFSIVVNDTTLEKQVELEKWKASHAIMESIKEKQIVKDGYSGVRLDFVPRPDVGDPRSIVVLHNEKYSYSISSETTHIDEILRMFTLFPYPYLGDTQRTTDIRMLQVALEQYRADRGLYPDTLQDLVPIYVVTLPLDPATQSQYLYHVSAAKLDYSLSAQLDDGTTLTREAPK